MPTLLGRHLVYRTSASTTAGADAFIEAELIIEPPRLWFPARCTWRTLSLSIEYRAKGRMRRYGDLCVVTLWTDDNLTRSPFFYVFRHHPGIDAHLGFVTGRTGRSLTPYTAEVVMSRRPLTRDDVVDLIGPSSSRYLNVEEEKARLARLLG